jgi:hypothetical protein
MATAYSGSSVQFIVLNSVTHTHPPLMLHALYLFLRSIDAAYE